MFLRGFYSIKFLLNIFLTLCLSFFFFLRHSSNAGNALFFESNSGSPGTPITRPLFIELRAAKSLSHSHKPASPMPSVPLAVFTTRHLSLSEPDEKTYDHLNKHRHSMASLSVRLRSRAFLYVVNVSVCVCVCVHACVSLCTQINCTWIPTRLRPACVCRGV